MATASPGEPTTPSGDQDPGTDVPDSDSPEPVPPDNRSGRHDDRDADGSSSFHVTEPAAMSADEGEDAQGDDAASGGS